MNPKYYAVLCTASALMATGALLLPPEANAQTTQTEEDVQILTRGPVHEAFAESVSFDPEPGIIIATQPPEPIEELPPEQQPEGDNVSWISGYWAWDEDQNDFIWISGIWRNLPPGRQWVPGYWSALEGSQYQWTSGYWADATVEEVAYIEKAPPRSVDVGPNIAAPSEDHSWIPGNWYWSDARYQWRPGYWTPLRTNWTWVPSRYNWSRRGYVYVDGYWDYAVARRGVLFAPVHFGHNVYRRPNYNYTPAIVVALSVFTDHLFIRPRSSHYYFGDYYAPRYRESGFFSSVSWHSGRRGYDPIYAYQRWDHRQDRDWERRRQNDFNYFRDNEDARPPSTWAAMRDYRDDRYDDGRNRTFASSFSDFTEQPKNAQRFRRVDEDRRKEIVSQRQEMREFSDDRRQRESQVRTADQDSKPSAIREKLSRSPVVGREADRFEKSEAPPKRPEARGGRSRETAAVKGTPEAETKIAEGDGRPESTDEKTPERGTTRREGKSGEDGKATLPGTGRDGTSEKAARKGDRPGTDASKEVPKTEGTRNETGREGDKPRESTVEPTPERGAAGRDGKSRTDRSGTSNKADRAGDRPATDASKNASPDRATQRGEQPKAETRPAPAPKIESAPKREQQPKAEARQNPARKIEAAPKRDEQPRAEARPAPERKIESAPKRESQPRAESRPTPERKVQAVPKQEVRRAPQPEAQPRPEVRQAPERKQQAAPQREFKPRPEVRQAPEPRQQAAPQRESQPKQQAREAPKPPQQAAPQRSEKKEKESAEEEEERKGSKR